MNIQELKKEIGLTVTELKSRFTELATLNGATRAFWEKAKSLLDNHAKSIKSTKPITPTIPTSPSESTDLQAIVDHYGFVYVADIISWYEIEIGAKERSLANPHFWDKLQQAVGDGLFDDFSEQSIDKNKCHVDNQGIVNNNGVVKESEYTFKNEADKKPSLVSKNDKDLSIDTLPQKISKQQILFNSELLPLVLNGKKTQTRRAWKEKTINSFLKAYENQELIKVHSNPYSSKKKLEGYLKLIKKPYQELVTNISDSDLKKEGCFGMSKKNFISKFFSNQNETVWVLNFEFIPLENELENDVKMTETNFPNQEKNGQYILFDYWQCDVEYPVYEEIISKPVYQWPLQKPLEKIKKLSRYWFLRLAAFVGVTSLDYCRDWILTFIKDKILAAKVHQEIYC